MHDYDDTLAKILSRGAWSNNRTGIRTKALYGVQCRYKLNAGIYGGPYGFPLVTVRKMFPKSGFAELIWFLSGSTNNNDLVKLGAKFWTPWVSREFEEANGFGPGDLGSIYGHQLRHFGSDYKTKADGFDQLAYMEKEVKTNPTSRRILFSLWNMKDYSQMRLAPCHVMYQVCINGNGELTGILTQRSNDVFVGVPVNVQFYSALTLMFAHVGGFQAGEFVHNMNDAHIYENQIPAVQEYLERSSHILPDSPQIKINHHDNICDYTVDDFHIINYNPLPAIQVPIAV